MGILMLFAAQQPLARDTEAFYNPKITEVEVTREGSPASYSVKGCMPTRLRTRQRSSSQQAANDSPKDLALADVSFGEFLTCKFILWLDLRTTDDYRLHGSDLRVENASEFVTIQITKQAEEAGDLNIYLYVVMDAQQNSKYGRFV